MSDALYTLGKFGKRARMMDLVDNGTVYMQQVRAFRNLEDPARGDRNEGAVWRVDPRARGTWINLNIGTKRIPILSGDVQFHGPHQNHAVYCMYAFPGGEGCPFRTIYGR